MAFNIFKLFVFVASRLNVSFDYVQAERFIRERREQWRLRRSCCGAALGVPKLDEPKAAGGSSVSAPSKENIFVKFKRAIEWVLEYNQTGYLQLFLITSHIAILIELVVIWTLYSLLPWDRNPATNEYEHPTLRFMESVYLFNVFENNPNGRIMSRMLALLWIQFSLLRLRSLYRIIDNSKVNRHRYKRINIVQINMACASAIQCDLNGWMRFLFHRKTHNCESGLSLETGQGKMMKTLSSRLNKGFHKIDRLYYFNQIEFENCYTNHHLFGSLTRDQDSEPTNYLATNSKAQPRTVKDCREKVETKPYRNLFATWNKLRASFVIERAAHQPFVPRPKYTVDPSHLRTLAIFYLVTTLMTVGILIASFAAIVLAEFDRVKSVYHCASIGTLYCLLQPNYLIRTAISFFGLCILAVNAYDNSLMAYSSALCHSRSNKVVKMLERENEFHRKLLRGFCAYLDAKGVSLDDPDVRSSDEDDENDDESDDDADGDSATLANLELKTEPLEKRLVLRSLSITAANHPAAHYKRNFGSIQSYVSRTRIDYMHPLSIGNKPDEPHGHSSVFNSTVAAYRSDLDLEKDLCEFNENIVYLMDLVGVLQSELSDLKDYFTAPIDLNILFGIVTSSIAINLLMGYSTKMELVIYMNTLILTIAPLIYTLFMGATSESSVSDISPM